MQHHGAVVVVPEGEAAVLVLCIGPLGLFGALRPAIETNELLHMLGGAVQADVEKVGFVVTRRNAGQRPDLGVAEFTLGQRFREQRQFGQCAGDTHLLPSGVGVDAAGPAQPVSAGQCPLRGPDFAAVELGDEGEKAVRGGVDVGGESGDGSGEDVVVHGGEIIVDERVESSH